MTAAATVLVPLAFLQRDAGDGSSLIETIVRVAVVAVFLLGPLLGSVLKRLGESATKRQQREQAPQRPRPVPRRDMEADGADLWRELLEGRAPERNPPPPEAFDPEPDVAWEFDDAPPGRPEPQRAPATQRAPEPSRRYEPPKPPTLRPAGAPQPATAHGGAALEDRPASLGGLLPADNARERSLAGFELVDEDAIEAGDRDAHVPLAQFSGLESSPFADMFERDPMRFAATTFTESAVALRSFSRAELRRAVLLAEVVAPPVTLRPPHDPLGAPGLRPL